MGRQGGQTLYFPCRQLVQLKEIRFRCFRGRWVCMIGTGPECEVEASYWQIRLTNCCSLENVRPRAELRDSLTLTLTYTLLAAVSCYQEEKAQMCDPGSRMLGAVPRSSQPLSGATWVAGGLSMGQAHQPQPFVRTP
jgi:hypothetical protein